MKLRFLMFYHRKNSVRDNVIGKNWIYLETKCIVHLRRQEQSLKYGIVSFHALSNFIG